MKHEIDMKNYNIRTDLLVDLFDINSTSNNISISKEEDKDISVIDILISDDNNELGKKKGKYTTISFKDITDSTNFELVEGKVINCIKNMMEYLNIDESKKGLVVGLGNRESTPDALGPKTIDDILVTKYLFDLDEIEVDPNYRNISSLVPGVLAVTGIESSDIIKGIITESKPDFLIVIDALASSSMERINKTIQITDTGINPGSGIGNNRKEISKEILGIPVISIGVPTVIEAIVLVSDTIQYMFKYFSYNKENFNKNKLVPITKRDYSNYEGDLSQEEKEDLLGQIGLLSEEETKALIFEVLTPIGYNMMVTPKEIDFLIEKLAKLIANSINKSLHKNFDKNLI